MFEQLLFTAIIGYVSFKAAQQFGRIRRNIFLGKPEVIEGNSRERWRNLALIALGQKKMFQNLLPAVMHFFIYAAFVITQIELIEILVDGFTGSHRFFAESLGYFYTFIISFIEILSVLAFVATLVFLARRNLLKVPRFRKAEMGWWPRLDGNIILYLEILLIFFIFTMNSADSRWMELVPERDHVAGSFAISGWLGPWLLGGISDTFTLYFLERLGWWGHIFIVFGFLLYLPYSKHLHIILSFPNVYYSKLTAKGQMENMPAIQQEVAAMFSDAPVGDYDMNAPLPKFGASDVFDLSWKNVLDAYSCTECGRCTAECPANLTGKLLSPRKIMMDVRDRAAEIGNNLDANKIEFIQKERVGLDDELTPANYNDGRNLFDYITEEELRACTTCNACVEACPVTINPLDIILQMRRYLILDAAQSPEAWNNMFTNVENNGAPWQFSRADRAAWVEEV